MDESKAHFAGNYMYMFTQIYKNSDDVDVFKNFQTRLYDVDCAIDQKGDHFIQKEEL